MVVDRVARPMAIVLLRWLQKTRFGSTDPEVSIGDHALMLGTREARKSDVAKLRVEEYVHP